MLDGIKMTGRSRRRARKHDACLLLVFSINDWLLSKHGSGKRYQELLNHTEFLQNIIKIKLNAQTVWSTIFSKYLNVEHTNNCLWQTSLWIVIWTKFRNDQMCYGSSQNKTDTWSWKLNSKNLRRLPKYYAKYYFVPVWSHHVVTCVDRIMQIIV